MALTAAKSARSVRNTVVRTTRSGPQPAAASTARRLASTWRVSASTSPSPTIVPLAGSRAIWPEQNSRPPAATAWL